MCHIISDVSSINNLSPSSCKIFFSKLERNQKAENNLIDLHMSFLVDFYGTDITCFEESTHCDDLDLTFETEQKFG